MALFGRHKNEPADVDPMPLEDMREALLSRRGTFWTVRDGADHNCDLVAEWFGSDANLRGGEMKAAYVVKMKFHEDEHSVHHNSEQKSSWTSGTGGGKSFQRGQSFQLGGGFSAGGGMGVNFNSTEITHTLRDTCHAYGWQWKAALFKL